jgi:hypothetical protein
MATRTILVDDVDGTESTDTNPVTKVEFAFPNEEGMLTMYAVDLTRDNAAKFVTAIKKYRDVATVVTMPSDRKRNRSSDTDSEAIRAWARSQTPPLDVSDRGRIPAELRAKFEAAQLSNTEQTDGNKSE